jgi:hypothetical protein
MRIAEVDEQHWMWEARVLRCSDGKRKPIYRIAWTVNSEKPSWNYLITE